MVENKSLPRVLIIDDELLQRKIISHQLSQIGFVSESAANPMEGIDLLQKKDFDVVLLDVQMAGHSGLEALPLIRKLEDAPEVIMLTLDKSLESGVTAMREGAYDYLTKPASPSALEVTIQKAAEKRRLIRQNNTLRDFVGSKISVKDPNSQIIHESSAMRRTFEQAATVARLNSTILITGESGTGKDVIARFVHNQSQRAKATMISVNCGAMPETLFESEFFGHEKGAFSGASQIKHGLIEVADGSTLFLDEVGEMPMPLQVKLLRFLENGEYRRVGGTRDLSSDVRLIAATNQDLANAINENRFRADLFYRLNVIHLPLPPLRDRVGDLPVLINHFLDIYRNQFHKPGLQLSSEARQKLESYHFPGNIRELKNIIERASALALGDKIESEQIIFPKTNVSEESVSRELDIHGSVQPNVSFDTTFSSDKKIVPLEELERRYILSILNHTGGNRELAAQLLGISERTLYRRLREYEE